MWVGSLIYNARISRLQIALNYSIGYSIGHNAQTFDAFPPDDAAYFKVDG